MPAFDPLTYRYASRRNVVYAKNAVACTSVPLGAQIGLDVMKSGGNAVDAAVAMAAAMPLLEPTGNGLGSDCFALVWIERDKRLYGLNASGVAPMVLSAEKVRAMGYTEMPKAGWLPTMVPGAPAGWAELNRRFGTKPLAELFAPAISYAEEGYPVPVNVARQWERDSRRIAKAMAENAAPHEYWWKSFIKPDGTPYRAGELFRFPDYDEDLHKGPASIRLFLATKCHSFHSVKQSFASLEKEFKYYRLSLYTFSLSSLMEVMLSGNFKESYISGIRDELQQMSDAYRDLFEESSHYLEKLSYSAIEANVLKGVGTAGNAVGKFIGSIPLVREVPVDEFLQDGGTHLKKSALDMEKDAVHRFASIGNPGTRMFMEKMDEMIQIYNRTEQICFDDKKIYLLPKKLAV